MSSPRSIGFVRPVSPHATANSAEAPSWALAATKMMREKIQRPLERVVGRLGIGTNLLSLPARRVETVRSTLIESHIDLATIVAALVHDCRAALVGDLLVGCAVEEQHRSIGTERLPVELTFEAASRIEGQCSSKPGGGCRRADAR